MKEKFKYWFYIVFCAPYFREALKKARDNGYNYAQSDLKEAYEKGKLYAIQEFKKDWFVEPYDVLTIDNAGRILKLGDDRITETELRNLKSEVKTLKNFKIWDIFQNTLRQKAIEKAVLNSTDKEQTLAGKMMIHCLGIFKSIVDILEK